MLEFVVQLLMLAVMFFWSAVAVYVVVLATGLWRLALVVVPAPAASAEASRQLRDGAPIARATAGDQLEQLLEPQLQASAEAFVRPRAAANDSSNGRKPCKPCGVIRDLLRLKRLAGPAGGKRGT
jgi:hypothetical protein